MDEPKHLTKVCTKCKKNKNITEFRLRKASKDGLHTQCKLCVDTISEKNRLENLELRKRQARSRSLKHKYGISIETYDELSEKQDNSCAICKKHRDSFKINFAVDHNHITGEIRGLLCYHCNHRVVGRHRDGELLRRVADYIDQGTGLYVPVRKPVKKRRKK